MTKIALAGAAVLAMSGIALPAATTSGAINSDHSVFVDETSPHRSTSPPRGEHIIVDPRTMTVVPTNESWPEFNRGIWGN